MQNHIPRLLLSATGSDSGKTTMMLALLSAFQKSGVVVQSYKSGPDYIDPMFHKKVLGVPSRFFCNQMPCESWLLPLPSRQTLP